MSKSVVADFGKRKKVLHRYKMSKNELYLLEGHTKGHTTRLMFQAADFLSSFAGYHHIDIHKEHWRYLGFLWALNSSVEYYVFCVLPFGLATVCYDFAKLMRPLV